MLMLSICIREKYKEHSQKILKPLDLALEVLRGGACCHPGYATQKVAKKHIIGLLAG